MTSSHYSKLASKTSEYSEDAHPLVTNTLLVCYSSLLFGLSSTQKSKWQWWRTKATGDLIHSCCQMKEMWKCMIWVGAGGCHPAAPASPRPRLSPRWLWSRGLQACLTALQVQNCTDMIWGGVGRRGTYTQVIFSGQENWRSQFCVLNQALKCSRWTLSMFMFKT